MDYRIITDPTEWDEQVLRLGGHPLQLWGWGELKSAHNWQAIRVVVEKGSDVIGGAQLLVRRLPGPLGQLVYIPRGPFGAAVDTAHVASQLVRYVKKHLRAVVITAEPDSENPMPPSWKQSANTILIPSTLILDLARSKEELLAAMTKKTRQYIRKSSGEAFTIDRVKNPDQLDQCLELYHETASRAGFAIHGDDYYQDVQTYLGESSVVFAAVKNGKPIAFLWLAVSGTTAFELYGGMNEEGQALRANYALKWTVIQKMQQWGIERYDFNGLLNDGVSTFKRGFASQETTLAGSFDYPLTPLYGLWAHGLPTAKRVMRRLQKKN